MLLPNKGERQMMKPLLLLFTGALFCARACSEQANRPKTYRKKA